MLSPGFRLSRRYSQFLSLSLASVSNYTRTHKDTHISLLLRFESRVLACFCHQGGVHQIFGRFISADQQTLSIWFYSLRKNTILQYVSNCKAINQSAWWWQMLPTEMLRISNFATQAKLESNLKQATKYNTPEKI